MVVLGDVGILLCGVNDSSLILMLILILFLELAGVIWRQGVGLVRIDSYSLFIRSQSHKYFSVGPHKRGGWRIPTVEKRQPQAVATDYAGPSILPVPHQSSEGLSMPIMVRTFDDLFLISIF